MGPLNLCSEQESIGVARPACLEILEASVRECVQTGTHAHDLHQYDGLFDTVGASLKAFPYPRLYFQWHINLPTTFSIDPEFGPKLAQAVLIFASK